MASGGGGSPSHRHIVVTVAASGTENTVTWYLDGVKARFRDDFGSGSIGAITPLWAAIDTAHRLQLFGDTRSTTLPWNGTARQLG